MAERRCAALVVGRVRARRRRVRIRAWAGARGRSRGRGRRVDRRDVPAAPRLRDVRAHVLAARARRRPEHAALSTGARASDLPARLARRGERVAPRRNASVRRDPRRRGSGDRGWFWRGHDVRRALPVLVAAVATAPLAIAELRLALRFDVSASNGTPLGSGGNAGTQLESAARGFAGRRERGVLALPCARPRRRCGRGATVAAAGDRRRGGTSVATRALARRPRPRSDDGVSQCASPDAEPAAVGGPDRRRDDARRRGARLVVSSLSSRPPRWRWSRSWCPLPRAIREHTSCSSPRPATSIRRRLSVPGSTSASSRATCSSRIPSRTCARCGPSRHARSLPRGQAGTLLAAIDDAGTARRLWIAVPLGADEKPLAGAASRAPPDGRRPGVSALADRRRTTAARRPRADPSLARRTVDATAAAIPRSDTVHQYQEIARHALAMRVDQTSVASVAIPASIWDSSTRLKDRRTLSPPRPSG